MSGTIQPLTRLGQTLAATVLVLSTVPATAASFDLNSDGQVDAGDAVLLNDQILGIDTDGDGYLPQEDCNVSDASINPAASEICDAIDNNCNGAVDEGNPGGGGACSTGLLGVCAAGTTSCQAGTLACAQNVSPSPETCDGLDNNCNGTVDEGNPGGGTACSTGLPGVCAAGTTSCQSGTLACAQNVSPSPEACDGLDNNCNGTVDEGNPGGGAACNTGLPGVCAAGTTSCQSGTLACAQNVSPSPEVCDGLDNNCDGIVDNGC